MCFRNSKGVRMDRVNMKGEEECEVVEVIGILDL